VNAPRGMPPSSDPTGVPAPCAMCGAPMTPTAAAHLHSNPEWACAYCGHREPFPADAAELHRYLRLRIVQLQRAREAAESPLRTFEMLKTAWVPGLVFMAVLGAFHAVRLVGSLRAGLELEPSTAVLTVMPIAVSFGVFAGWMGMRRAFVRHLRPILRARPPRSPGLAARCRSCGGALPLLRAPQVKCGFCAATNVLDDALTTQVGALLAQEASDHRQRVQRWTDPRVYLAPSRAFYVFGAVGAVAVLMVGTAVVLAAALRR
jgi:hypothetical protein